MKLNSISSAPGARKTRLRVGRGASAGQGKTCGRGVKGQNSRRGVHLKGFEGGQMPIQMRIPKRGFNKHRPDEFAWVNLSRLQKAIDSGKLDAKAVIDEAALQKAGLVRRVRDGVRLLGKGAITAKIQLVVTGATAAAIAAVEKAGGSVKVTAETAEA